MIEVAVSGAGGQMGRMIVAALDRESDIVLGHLYDPYHVGMPAGNSEISDDPSMVADASVVVEFTHPDVVMENLSRWRDMGVHAVVGTSGFTQERIDEASQLWAESETNLLIVPNFAIGAVLMMRFSELAAPYFSAAEIVELHHDRKADAPSGTAIATAKGIAAAQPEQVRAVESAEIHPGATGATVDGVKIHSVRLPGIIANQEVIFGGPGQSLTIRHDTTDRTAFAPGVLLAVRNVANAPDRVSVGLDSLLDL